MESARSVYAKWHEHVRVNVRPIAWKLSTEHISMEVWIPIPRGPLFYRERKPSLLLSSCLPVPKWPFCPKRAAMEKLPEGSRAVA